MEETKKISSAKKKKIERVEKLTAKIKQAKSLTMVDYRGLSHQQLEELRRKLKSAAAEFTVVKNSLLKRALQNSNLGIDPSELKITGPTALLTANEDEINPLKVLSQFIKETGYPVITKGILNDRILSAEEVNRLANLPSRDVLLAQLVGRINSPLFGLHRSLSWNLNKLIWALQEVKKKKEAGMG